MRHSPSHRVSLPFDQYRFILLGDRVVYKQLAYGCYLKAEHKGVEPTTLESRVQYTNDYITSVVCSRTLLPMPSASTENVYRQLGN